MFSKAQTLCAVYKINMRSYKVKCIFDNYAKIRKREIEIMTFRIDLSCQLPIIFSHEWYNYLNYLKPCTLDPTWFFDNKRTWPYIPLSWKDNVQWCKVLSRHKVNKKNNWKHYQETWPPHLLWDLWSQFFIFSGVTVFISIWERLTGDGQITTEHLPHPPIIPVCNNGHAGAIVLS